MMGVRVKKLPVLVGIKNRFSLKFKPQLIAVFPCKSHQSEKYVKHPENIVIQRERIL